MNVCTVFSDNGGVDFVVTYERVLFIVLCNNDELPAGNFKRISTTITSNIQW